MSKLHMKKFVLFPIAAALALVVSCEKPPSEAERNAQIEREVQQRLAAERQADEQKRLAQQAADLEAREKALAEKEAAANRVQPTAVPVRETRTESETRVVESDDQPQATYGTFYRKLEPYGAWRETNDYGYVWQPRAAQGSRNWRPYTDGRWAYTEAGWTWISDEPFGWATYHYGRWTRLSGVGWVWVPGEEWAPAWVSWRTGGDHVGWAPLPPEARFERSTGIKKWADSYYDIDADEYVFVPDQEIGADNLEQYVIPADRNVSIVNQTVNVTNITYINTTVVNEGPNYDELRQRSRQAVPRWRLERESRVRDDRNPQAAVRAGVVSMMTPLFLSRSNERPRTEGAPIRDAKVERNWASGGNRAEAERTREKMRSEATPPSNAPSKRFEKPVIPANAPIAEPVTGQPAIPTPPPRVRPTPPPAPIATPAPTETISATATPAATMIPRPTPRPRPTFTPMPRVTPVATPEPPDALEAVPAPTIDPRAARDARARESVERMRQKMEAQGRQSDRRRLPPATPPPTIEPAATAAPDAGVNEATPIQKRPRPGSTFGPPPGPAAVSDSPATGQPAPGNARGNPRRGLRALEPNATPTPAPKGGPNEP